MIPLIDVIERRLLGEMVEFQTYSESGVNTAPLALTLTGTRSIDSTNLIIPSLLMLNYPTSHTFLI